jgi:anti-sigma-K factor RskA
MDEERLDFRALDPSVDADRWHRIIDSVATRGMAARRTATHRPSVTDLLAGWRRPAMALAAVLALVAVPVLLFVEPETETAPRGKAEVALAVVDWAWAGQSQDLDLLDAVGR